MPIFRQDEILSVMPDKVDAFDIIKERFKEITSSAHEQEPLQYSRFCRLPIFPFQSD
jgi:hypothetical protein